MLSNFFDQQIALQNKTIVDDGYGNYTTTYSDGAVFSAGIVRDTSTEMSIAEQNGTKAVYTLVFALGIEISIGDRLRRLSDGSIFVATSNSSDTITPIMASAAMAHGECKAKLVTTP